MGPEIGAKVKEEALMEVSRCGEDKNAALSLGKQSASSGQAKIHDVEASSFERTMMFDRSEDMEIDIIGCSDNCEPGPSSTFSTEKSSSFGDTVSGTDYGLLVDDEEVESQIYGDNSLQPTSNGYREVFPRKRKLTDHWRKFISPLMWRCRWLEMQIKKLQSQSLKYDRELALYDQRNQSICEHFSMEGFDVKSTGFSSHIQRHRVMKRKRRKKTEETTEVAAYMAHHNLFSYFEKKGSFVDDMTLEDTLLKLDKTRNRRHLVNNDFGTIATDGWTSSMWGDDDRNMEEIFQKIAAAQSKTHELKNRIDKVLNENPVKFTSINKLCLLPSSGDPASPENANDELVRSLHEASQHISDHALDVLMPESANKSHGEVMLLANVIQRANCRSAKKVLMQDSAVKEEVHLPEEVKGQFINEQTLKLEEQKVISPAAVSQVELASENKEPDIQHETEPSPAVKPSTSKKARKRGKRKVSWSKRRKATG